MHAAGVSAGCGGGEANIAVTPGPCEEGADRAFSPGHAQRRGRAGGPVTPGPRRRGRAPGSRTVTMAITRNS
eukprot:6347107-Prymnesium_polylepis.1